MKIYVVGSSKNKFLQLDEIRQTFLVDKELHDDNINSQNNMFCETVALYYMWKHENSDIVGLEHYRRNFFNIFTNKLLSKNAIEKYLSKYDVIMSYKNRDPLRKDLKDDIISHITEDGYNNVMCVLKSICSENEYKYYEFYFSRTDKHGYNLFITKNNIMKEYAEFFFKVIDNLTVKMPLRSYGYISEFLLNGWMEYHNYKIKPLPYLLTVNGRCQIGDLGWSYADNYE